MMVINRFLILAFVSALLALFSGCATRPAHAPLPELATLPAIEARTQRLTFTHREERHRLLGVLRHDERTLQLALLSPQGQRLMTLVVDEDGARFRQGDSFDPPFTAEWLASRLAWTLWPAHALDQAFSDSDWELWNNAAGRIIEYRGRPVVRITGSDQCRIIDDIEGGYRLYIAPLGDDTDRTEAACPTD